MKHFMLAPLLASLVLGCTQQQPAPAPPPKKGGVHITAPGVNVDVDPDGDTKVRAPGVKVDVKPKDR
jgi:hypothetical protein